MKSSRKSCRAAGDHILRAIKLQKYRSIKHQFEKELRETNKKNWRKFVEENLSLDIWVLPYKNMRKVKTKGSLNTLKDDQDNFTTN